MCPSVVRTSPRRRTPTFFTGRPGRSPVSPPRPRVPSTFPPPPPHPPPFFLSSERSPPTTKVVCRHRSAGLSPSLP